MSSKPKPRPATIDGEIARVPLSRGFFAIIDAADAATVSQFSWSASVSSHPGGQIYARRMQDGREQRLHRFLLRPTDGLWVDHINGDSLDNRRSNLRLVTKSQSGMNRLPPKEGQWGRGVSFHNREKLFDAHIKVNRRTIHLGYFKTIEEARECRQEAERRHFGEYSPLVSRPSA